jgi:TP901 family phage tail tape measure protein
MFDVGSIRATLEVAGGQAFTQAFAQAGDAADQLRAKLTGAGVPLKQVETSARSAGTALGTETQAAKQASTQAAVLDKSLGQQANAAEDAAKAAKQNADAVGKQAKATGTAADAADQNADATEDAAKATAQSGQALEDQVRASRAAAKAMDEATAAVEAEEAAARAAERSTQTLSQQLGNLSGEGKAAFTEVGQAALGFGAILGAGVGVAVHEFAEFDSTMSEVQAASGATGAQFEKLRGQAIELGADTAFSAKEAAEGQTELAKAGVATKDILGGGLQGALALAAAGQISVGEAAETAATAMTQFNLNGSQVPHIADLLANGANKAQGGVHDLGMALNQSGLVASQFGVSVDDTVGALAAFASQGLIGSDAGTSLKQMFLQLAAPTDKAGGLLEQYNVHAYDAQGNFVGLASLAGQLQAGFAGVSVEERNMALSVIFGSDAIRAANVLYSEGQENIQGWTDAVGEAGGAATTAATLQNNLAGDLEKLGGAFSSLFITAGDGANGPLRQLVQSLTGLVDVVNGLPAPVSQAALGLTAGVAALALLGGGFLTAVPKAMEFRSALKTINTEVPQLGKLAGVGAMLSGGFAVGLTVATSLLGYYLQEQARASAETAAFGDSLDQTTGSLTDQSRALAEQNLKTEKSFLWFKSDSAFDSAEKLGLSLSKVTDAAMGNDVAFKQLKKSMDQIREDSGDLLPDDFMKKYGISNSEAADAMRQLNGTINDQRGELGEAKKQWDQVSESQEGAAGTADGASTSVDGAASALDTMQQSAQEAKDQIDGIVESLKGLQDTNVSAIEAEAAFQQAIDDASEAVAKNKDGLNAQNDALNQNSTSFDLTTEAGRNATSSMLDIAQAAKDSAGALYEQTGSQDSATGALKSGSDALREALKQYGITGKSAQAYIDTVLGTPESWATVFQAETGTATGQVGAFREVISRIPGSKNFKVVAATGDAQLTIDNFIRQNDGRVVRIATVNQVQEVRVGSGPSGTKATQANGGLWSGGVQYFADGGFGGVEYPHVAHFAAGGTWRTFAEPETLGEAYIPLSPMKRDRSTEILDQTASMFGYDLVKPGTQAVAGAASMSGVTLSGTLDLGNGLTGFVEGVLDQSLSRATSRGRQSRRN